MHKNRKFNKPFIYLLHKLLESISRQKKLVNYNSAFVTDM